MKRGPGSLICCIFLFNFCTGKGGSRRVFPLRVAPRFVPERGEDGCSIGSSIVSAVHSRHPRRMCVTLPIAAEEVFVQIKLCRRDSTRQFWRQVRSGRRSACTVCEQIQCVTVAWGQSRRLQSLPCARQLSEHRQILGSCLPVTMLAPQTVVAWLDASVSKLPNAP